MFETVKATAPDPILALMMAFREDQRDGKIDLGVGVYKDATGKTPVMQAIKLAEQKLHNDQDTKTYVSPTGDLEFCDAVENLIFQNSVATERVKAIQTPGGSGALRILSDMLISANPDAKTWVPDPTWPNHIPMLEGAGHSLDYYTYYDAQNCRVDFDAMVNALQQAKKGDIVLLHGCCHNPSGADLSTEQWKSLATLFSEKGLKPFVDLAYQGFADGLNEDAEGIHILANALPEMVVATSCSKNMALYRERAGCALVVADNQQAASNTASLLVRFIRQNYSMPPDHGAALSRIVLLDDDLRTTWKEELETMRVRLETLRSDLAGALRKRSNSDRFDYIAAQKGMFSRLPLLEEQTVTLREQHGIYMVGDGRINVAGLPGHSEEVMDQLASRIVAVMS